MKRIDLEPTRYRIQDAKGRWRPKSIRRWELVGAVFFFGLFIVFMVAAPAPARNLILFISAYAAIGGLFLGLLFRKR